MHDTRFVFKNGKYTTERFDSNGIAIPSKRSAKRQRKIIGNAFELVIALISIATLLVIDITKLAIYLIRKAIK